MAEDQLHTEAKQSKAQTDLAVKETVAKLKKIRQAGAPSSPSFPPPATSPLPDPTLGRFYHKASHPSVLGSISLTRFPVCVPARSSLMLPLPRVCRPTPGGRC